MATAVARKPQDSLPGLGREKELSDSVFERQLIERERMKTQLAEYRKKYDDVDDEVKARIKELRVKGAVRCGVAFETKPSKRIYIKAVGGDS